MPRYRVISEFVHGHQRVTPGDVTFWDPPSTAVADRLVAAGCLQVHDDGDGCPDDGDGAGGETPSLADLRVGEIKDLVAGTEDLAQLDAWLSEEQTGKDRSGAVKAILERLEELAQSPGDGDGAGGEADDDSGGGEGG